MTMGRRTQIETLPADIRRELDAKIVANGFGDYQGLTEWLESRCLRISKSAIHRHGQDLQEQHDEAMADARAILALTRASGDIGESGSEIATGAAAILQADILRTALELRRETNPDKRATYLAKLTRAQADIGRMITTVEKHLAEARDKIAAKMAALDAEAKSGTGSLDPATLKRVREEIYGIV